MMRTENEAIALSPRRCSPRARDTSDSAVLALRARGRVILRRTRALQDAGSWTLLGD